LHILQKKLLEVTKETLSMFVSCVQVARLRDAKRNHEKTSRQGFSSLRMQIPSRRQNVEPSVEFTLTPEDLFLG